MYLWLAKLAETLRRDEGQGVSEYAMILVLIVLIVVSVVHAIGSNAQHVIDSVNSAIQ
jgi:Flp pilus assembly pilin Flp